MSLIPSLKAAMAFGCDIEGPGTLVTGKVHKEAWGALPLELSFYSLT